MEIELQIGGEKVEGRAPLDVNIDEAGEMGNEDGKLGREVVIGSVNEADILGEMIFYAQNPGEFNRRYGTLLKVCDEKTQKTSFNLDEIDGRLRDMKFKILGEDEGEFIGEDGKPQWYRLVYIASGGDDGEFADILQNRERYKVGNLTKTRDGGYFILVKDKTENRERRVEVDEGLFKMDAGLEYLMQFAKEEIVPEENRKKDLSSILKGGIFEEDLLELINRSFTSSFKEKPSFSDYSVFNYDTNCLNIVKKHIKNINLHKIPKENFAKSKF